ncbi:MAG: 23S rRNA pseudouridine synthase [bacterium P3]|nr:MAG: 23S rRNA pseudouridine synthase [bacterium P3]KWW42665.1 MAG: 23S rRNA pseudouridine synthase [bacterium F083]
MTILIMIGDRILYEDNHLLAFNKRPGEIVQGDKTGDEPLSETLKRYIKERDHKPGNVFCGVVHRIDRPVSGVVLFAKTSKALSRMNRLVQQRAVTKIYWAVTKAMPPHTSGTLSDYLVRNERLNKSFVATASDTGAKHSLLDYRLIATSSGGYHLLEVNLHTGRHHQVRCQLAHIGCPIRGDLKYGAPRSNADGSIALHARSIAFTHPVSLQPLCIVAPWDFGGITFDFMEKQI